MDQQAFELLKLMMENHREHTDKRFDDVQEQLRMLTAFKWKVLGGYGVLSVLMTMAMHVIFS